MDEREETAGAPLGARRPVAAPAPAAAVLRDVNERLLIAGLREQELAAALEAERARLATILASIGDAVLVVDRDGRPLLTNAAYTHMVETLAVVPALESEDGQPLTPTDAPWRRAARGEAFAVEFGAVDADGTRHWWEARGQPIGRARARRGASW